MDLIFRSVPSVAAARRPRTSSSTTGARDRGVAKIRVMHRPTTHAAATQPNAIIHYKDKNKDHAPLRSEGSISRPHRIPIEGW